MNAVFIRHYRKRALHTSKDIKSYFTLLILPCLFVALALGVSKIVPDRTNQPSLDLSSNLYPDTYSFYRSVTLLLLLGYAAIRAVILLSEFHNYFSFKNSTLSAEDWRMMSHGSSCLSNAA